MEAGERSNGRGDSAAKADSSPSPLRRVIASPLLRLGVRRRRAGARDAETRAEHARRMAEMGAMAAGLAHEIKNPLSTIGLNAQLLAESVQELQIDPDTRDALARRVRTLGAEADRLRDILTDFLEFAGEIKLDLEKTDLNRLVEEIADFYMPQAQRQHVRMRVELAPGPLIVTMDAKLIKQAVLNLVLNAVQAMTRSTSSAAPPAGESGHPRELILRTRRRTGSSPGAALHVIDTGPGIPADALASIFDPYFTTKPSGSGLGLPTSRRIVEHHHGRLDVHTEPGRGTDFTIVLPE